MDSHEFGSNSAEYTGSTEDISRVTKHKEDMLLLVLLQMKVQNSESNSSHFTMAVVQLEQLKSGGDMKIENITTTAHVQDCDVAINKTVEHHHHHYYNSATNQPTKIEEYGPNRNRKRRRIEFKGDSIKEDDNKSKGINEPISTERNDTNQAIGNNESEFASFVAMPEDSVIAPREQESVAKLKEEVANLEMVCIFVSSISLIL